jgi:hypothetical protein
MCAFAHTTQKDPGSRHTAGAGRTLQMVGSNALSHFDSSLQA